MVTDLKTPTVLDRYQDREPVAFDVPFQKVNGYFENFDNLLMFIEWKNQPPQIK